MATRQSVAILLALAVATLSALHAQSARGQAPTYTVSGQVIGGPPVLQGLNGGGLTILLSGPPLPDLRSPIKPDGSFEFLNVPPGSYAFTTFIHATWQQSITRIVVADKDVIGVKVPLVQTEVVTRQQNLEVAWSLPGKWSGLARSVTDGTIYAAAPNTDAVSSPPFARVTLAGRIREIDYDGKIRREFSAPPFRGLTISVAHFSGSSAPVILAFGGFADTGVRPFTGADLHAFDANGRLLWRYATPGIQDFVVVDSGEQNQDRVAIVCDAFTATNGLQALDGSGAVFWKTEKFGLARRGFSGDVRGTGAPQIIATSRTAGTRIFDEKGSPLPELDPSISVLSVAKVPLGDGGASIFGWIGGANESRATITGLSGFGERRWSVQLPSKITPPSVDKGLLAWGRPWLAVAMRDGQVSVIDTQRGIVVASIDGQSWFQDIAWIEGKNGVPPRLMISSKGSLRAYNVVVR